MNDMSAVIVPKSDQWNADDFLSGPLTFTINEVHIKGGEEQPVDIFVDGSKKAYRPCKSMSRVLVGIWGPDAGKYIGRSLTLYRDPNVRFGKDAVGGIRISHMTDIPPDKLDNGRVVMALTATRAQRKPHVIKPLVLQQAGQQRQGATAGLSPAAQFARDHIEGVQNAESVEVLDQIIAEDAKGLNRLKGDEPQLFADCEIAAATRRAQLEAPGPDVSQSGESTGGYGDDDAPAEAWGDFYLRTKGAIRMAADLVRLDAAMDAFDKRASEGTDEQVAEIRGLAATKRASLN